MNIPKHDGSNGRYYLIYKASTDKEILSHADMFIYDIRNGASKEKSRRL